MMNQRQPMKQYAYPNYSYQGRGGYGPGSGMKGMQQPHEYYEEYNYAEPEMPGPRGGRMEHQPGYPPARQPKGPKQMGDRPQAQYSGYQYPNQQMSPMYQPVPHPMHYEVRNPYDYGHYKAKAGDVKMPPAQAPAYYNYGKPMTMPPYSYTANHQYGNQHDQEDEEEDIGQQQAFREDHQAAGPKTKKIPAKQAKPTDEHGDSKIVKMGKAKQFAEDLEENMDD